MTFAIAGMVGEELVLVSDRRISSEGAPPAHKDKVASASPLSGRVAFSGPEVLFSTFLSKLQECPRGQSGYYETLKILKFAEDAIRKINETDIAREQGMLAVLLCLNTVGPDGFRISDRGRVISVASFQTIGVGSHWNEAFLARAWPHVRTVEDVARLGYFIPALMEELEPNGMVGLGGVAPMVYVLGNHARQFRADSLTASVRRQVAEVKGHMESFAGGFFQGESV